MHGCAHYFTRAKGGRVCVKCGYRQRRFRRGNWRARRRGRRASGAMAAAAIAVCAAVVAAVALGQPGPGGLDWPVGAGPERGVRAADEPVEAAPPGRESGPAAVRDECEKPPEQEMAELYGHALELANRDRAERGLAPVALSGVGSAQDHADDMMELGYFSHWDSDGVKPYATYTKHGGTGYVGENVAANLCPGRCPDVDPFEAIEEHHWNMVYRDAHADWGHRDNILDPAHTHVNFGVSHGGGNLYFVQHFESNPAGWSDVHVTGDGRLVMEGVLPGTDGIQSIMVYRDPQPVRLSARELDAVEPYSLPFYEWGETAGMVVEIPPGGAYRECPNGDLLTEDGCVPYSVWSADARGDGRVRLTADVSKWAGSGGLHTAIVFLDGGDGAYPSSSLTLEYLERRP